MNRVELDLSIERVPLKTPFRITGHTFTHCESVVVSLRAQGCTGTGEANGVYYHGETPASMAAQVQSVRGAIQAGADNAALQTLLPPGGARNAVDCAWWALQSRVERRPVWQLAGLEAPRPVTTTVTLSAESPTAMAAAAAGLQGMPRVKLKLLGDGQDAARVRAVRDTLPEVWLMVDANQGLDRDSYLALLPTAVACGVQLIEQPFPIGHDAWLDGLPRPVPVAADESCLVAADLQGLVGRCDMASIKLDKCGGFTEALRIIQTARTLGLGLMVGCMGGRSQALAPAFVVGQACEVCDIDGPLFITTDSEPALHYAQGIVTLHAGPWGP